MIFYIIHSNFKNLTPTFGRDGVSSMYTYVEAKQLISTTKSFYEIKICNVSIFTYQFAKYKDFNIVPIARWMRGITFVNN